MIVSRRLFTSSIVLALLFITSAATATTLQPSCDPSATLINTTHLSAPMGPLLGVTDGGNTEFEVFEYLLSNGDTTLVIDPETVTFSGPCTGLDNVDLATLFNYISREAVRDAVNDGRIGSTTNCSARFATTVMVPTCVTRIGYGAGTTFMNIDDCTQSTRTFSHCINGGAPQMTAITGITSCADGESTCEKEEGGGLN